MEILHEKTMNAHDTEFKLMTRSFENGGSRIDLFRVVNGMNELLLGRIDSYSRGIEYLDNEYYPELQKFNSFIESLEKAVKESFHLFDFDPPEWPELTDSCTRHINVVHDDFVYSVEIEVQIQTGYRRIMDAKAVWVEVLNSQDMQMLVERFSHDCYRKFDSIFCEELVS